MKLSKPQIDTFWSMWARVCRAAGWTDKAQCERERKAFLARCGFSSLTLVDKIDGFTKVKNELQILLTPDLQAAREADDQGINRARNLRFVIRHELLPCLALYEPAPGGYLITVLAGQGRWRTTDRPEVDPALEDFGEAVLKRVMMTLNARIQEKRRAAGHSLHEMKTAAGVKCDCKVCRRFIAEEVAAGTGEVAMVEGPF